MTLLNDGLYLDYFVSWNAGAANKDLYVYDASGNRVLRRTTTSSGTTMTVCAFGLEEHSYFNISGHKGDLYYYTLGGRLLGALDNTGKTTFYLTDALGSVLASFSNAAGNAAIKGNQVFGPYGNARDVQGTINTAKGFTGQYNDSLTRLDYYGSRYYDQVAGVFLSESHLLPWIFTSRLHTFKMECADLCGGKDGSICIKYTGPPVQLVKIRRMLQCYHAISFSPGKTRLSS